MTSIGALVDCVAGEPTLPSTSRTVNFSELSTHSTKGDCWFNLGCNIFSIGTFNHPGGDIIYQICGTTGTSLFMAKHRTWQYIPDKLLSDKYGLGQFIGRAQYDYNKGPGVAEPGLVSFTLEQVAQHNTKSDCWTCISGNVYDVTYYFSAHPGGSHVLEYLCGQDSTLHYLQNHILHRVDESLLTKGTCPMVDLEKAWTEQNLLDGLALLLYAIVPILVAVFVLRCGTIRLQDELFRKPIRKPIRSEFLGKMFNGHLEMPIITVALSFWFVGATILMLGLWVGHYQKWYPLISKGSGALGRVTIYLVCLATILGTRRWSFSWLLFRISYEKTLKAHYVAGSLASIATLVHGIWYIAKYNCELPGNALKTGGLLLAAVLVVFPAAAFTNLRVAWYSVFKLTHLIAPMIIFLSIAHVVSMSVDHSTPRGMRTTLAWVLVTGIFWIIDFVYTRYDLFFCAVSVVRAPEVVRDPSGDYITVTLTKRAQVTPGSWMQVASLDANTPFGHPFTAIVKTNPPDGFSQFQFIWKVNGTKSWTGKLKKGLEGKGNCKFLVTGPYGGGLGTLAAMEVIVFVVGGVGVTPAASMIPHLVKTKEVHFVWSCRSRALLELVVNQSFDDATRQYFRENPTRCHVTSTTVAPSMIGSLIANEDVDTNSFTFAPFRLQNGRLDVKNIIGRISEDSAKKSIMDIGVFVCGPKALVIDVLEMGGMRKTDGAYVHVHSESFQL